MDDFAFGNLIIWYDINIAIEKLKLSFAVARKSALEGLKRRMEEEE